MTVNFSTFKREVESKGIHLLPTVTKLAMDADPQPLLPPSGGIPAIVSTFIDPTVVRTLFTPNRAVNLFGEGREQKKGSWAQDSFMIQRVEHTGDTVAYDDYSEQGSVQVNNQWEIRQVYRYQTMVQYGELEQERYGLAMLAYAAEKQRAAIEILNQDQNKFYFYGIAGINNYGILNDPSLPAPIAPLPDPNAAGAVQWKDKSVLGIYNDILALYEDLVTRTKGIVGNGIDVAAPLVLAMSPQASVWLKKANEIFGNTPETMVRNMFPNLRIEIAPQYSTPAGELVQMFVESAQGQDVGYLAYSEKLRAHPLVTEPSWYKQKYSASTYGAIITQPYLFAQMIGV